ncbi:hypothetical protein C0989_008649 [Termitomyces sp. Mn162]|nr:hypothetical protein C0989_008649 [Termitomyces sp. Mn162]
MGLRVLAIDTGAAKKELCAKLGAEKWVDFQESTNLVTDVRAATNGHGPHVALIAVGDVRTMSSKASASTRLIENSGTTIQSSPPVSSCSWDVGRHRYARRKWLA